MSLGIRRPLVLAPVAGIECRVLEPNPNGTCAVSDVLGRAVGELISQAEHQIAERMLAEIPMRRALLAARCAELPRPNQDHYECHVVWYLLSKVAKKPNVFVRFDKSGPRSGRRGRGGRQAFEVTFMQVEEADLNRLEKKGLRQDQ